MESQDIAIPRDMGNAEKPFVVANLGYDARGDSFRPSAVAYLTSALRTSGLLHALPGDDLKNLILILTFLHPNGWCQPTIFEIAHAMNVTQPKARERMERLTMFQWLDVPLVTELKRDSGMDAYAPSPLIMESRVTSIETKAQPAQPASTGNREAVIAHTREWYARPRAEVERQMAIDNGWPLPEEMEANRANAKVIEEDADHSGARRQLLRLNVPNAEVERLLSTYPIERILKQLLWLPNRGAKSKARFIVAAIDGDYGEPGARHSA